MFKLSVIFLLVLTQQLSTASDEITPKVQKTKSGLFNIITDNIKELTNNLQTIRKQLHNAIANFQELAMGTITNATEELTEIFDEAQKEFDALRNQYNDTKFDSCFPIGFLPDLMLHALDGVKSCVMDIFLTPYNTATTLLQEIDNLLKRVGEFPNKVKNCGRFGVVCLSKILTVDIAKTGLAVSKVSLSVSSTISYFSSLQYTFVPCTVIKARYEKLTWTYVKEASDCVANIIKATVN